MATDAALTIRLNPADNVVVARADILPGTAIPGETVATRSHVPSGHKLATRAVKKGEAIRKYNQIIGFATAEIRPGEHVHTQNCEFAIFERAYEHGVDAKPTQYFTGAAQATFQGFKRRNGEVGTRNYIGILSSVNCSAHVSKVLAQKAEQTLLKDFPNVDGVVALTHGTGCGMAASGEGIDVLRRTIAGYARHPNFAGILMIGLGCEVNQIGGILAAEELEPGPFLHPMTIQDSGGSASTVRVGLERIKEMLPEVNKAMRSTVPAAHITIGLQCGGSDGYSGISANPALGAASDLLVRHGGSVLLSETPETYGAEHMLVRRAVSGEVGLKLVELIQWWLAYTEKHGGSMDNNPSPGNKAGGLTTILEKALGASAKGGTTNLVDVIHYAAPLRTRGFVFMDSPGYDPVSATGQVASGSNMICFTTGRGSVFGCKPAPSIKLTTNTPLYKRMPDDMDINCGTVIDGSESVQEAGERIFKLILEVASGKRTKSEEFGFGEDEFQPWQIGAVM
ncbi:MAG: altronate dehydratase [Proteobacteria bacterium]|nr:altronate dehydratase [Pseudomonadota bacterium]MBI3499126.1 altronate dehydratase [Pseudomonadota bacterium]